jgi:DNA-binding NarL/FixJ family response regulator
VTVRVLLADDQPAIRAGFRMLINSTDDLTVVAEAANGREAVDLARTTRPDVAVMDIRMPVMDGLEAARLITADRELAGVRVLVLTTFELDEYVFEALRAGASGFVGKGVGPDELIEAVRLVAQGEELLSPAATRALIAHFLSRPETDPSVDSVLLESLTQREREVVALVGLGLSNHQIAERLFLSPLTAKTHVNRAMTKLAVRDRAQLVVIAYRSGLVRSAHP